MRDWKNLQSDEIYAIWKGYLHNDFPGYGDPLRMCPIIPKAVRLTPMEIIQLVDELMNRLEIKENPELK